MKKILIAVDDTRTSRAVLSTFYNAAMAPEEVILLHVERLQGRSLMIDMLGDPELSTLRESLKDTTHQEELDEKADTILSYYKKQIENGSTVPVKTMVRAGIPAEEITRVAEEEAVDLIIVGYSGRKGLDKLISGSVAQEVRRRASTPVLMAKSALMCEEPYTWKDAYAAVSITTAVVLGLFIIGVILEKASILH